MSRERLFNRHRVRLRRTRIPLGENLSAAMVLATLLALIAWLTTTRSDFDPTERDLPIELLGASGAIQLYNRPLKPWVEPGRAPAAAGFDLKPFPVQILDETWRPAGRVKRFQPDNLYEKVNGEAEKFLKLGFVELAFLRVHSTDDNSEIAIELFDQGGLGGSLGVFSEHTAGQAVEERNGVSFVTTAAGAVGRVGRYFFRFAGDRQSAAIGNKTARLITAFAQLVGERPDVEAEQPQLPPGFELLNRRLGIAEGDIQFQEYNVFQYDFAQRFWFGNVGLGDDARLFLHIADTEAAADELLSALLEEHGYEYDEVDNDAAYRVFRHRFLGSYFVLAQRGRYLFGLEQLSDTAAVDGLLQQMSEALQDDET